MQKMGHSFWLVLGLTFGIAATVWLRPGPQLALAGNDRHEDYVLATGTITLGPNVISDAIWLLDYRAGKLLGTMVDKNAGKIVGWAEVDLVTEFALPPRQNVHFLMTTGMITQGQAALYIAETTSGKIAVYTMGARADGKPGVMIRKHDLVMFRGQAKAG